MTVKNVHLKSPTFFLEDYYPATLANVLSYYFTNISDLLLISYL